MVPPRGFMRHTLLVVICLAALLFPAFGSSATRADGVRTRDVVPIKVLGQAGTVQGSGNLTYHGGAVMRTIVDYAIFWIPSGYSYNAANASYENTINRYFTDVAADSGKNTNVYSTDSQYYDTIGGGTTHIAYSATFGGSIVVTTPFPANGCHEAIDTSCLTEAQLEAEIRAVVQAQGWPQNGSSQYFLFTPKGNGSCFDSNAADGCAYTSFCAYHNSFSTGSGHEIIFADQPWTANWPSAGNAVCDVRQYPNASDADPTINVVSHENNEAITDPNLNAWFDNLGYEDGDKCAWTFGVLSGSSGSYYNQTINGHHYLMQEEYNNAGQNCVQSVSLIPVNTAVPTITGTAYVGQTLTGHAGSWTNSPTKYTYTWLRCDSAGNNCSTIISVAGTTSISTAYNLVSADAGHRIKLTVTATNFAGPSGLRTSSATGVVLSPPVNSSAPTITGTATVGQVLTGHAGSWANSPTKYSYTWLRCDASGNSCSTIMSATTTATTAAYALVPVDDKHTIKLSVTASNSTGASAATTTGATAVVNGEPIYTSGLSITGTMTVGQTITAHAGTWTLSPTAYTYAWLRCDSSGNACSTITTASSSSTTATYTLVSGDDRHTIRVTLSATNGAGSGTPHMSAATTKVNGEPVNTAAPTIAGTTVVGQKLKAHAGSWSPAATTYTYVWQRCSTSGNSCVTIATTANTTSTASPYILTSADQGHTIRVTVTATNSAGSSDPKQSSPTTLVS